MIDRLEDWLFYIWCGLFALCSVVTNTGLRQVFWVLGLIFYCWGFYRKLVVREEQRNDM